MVTCTPSRRILGGAVAMILLLMLTMGPLAPLMYTASYMLKGGALKSEPVALSVSEDLLDDTEDLVDLLPDSATPAKEGQEAAEVKTSSEIEAASEDLSEEEVVEEVVEEGAEEAVEEPGEEEATEAVPEATPEELQAIRDEVAELPDEEGPEEELQPEEQPQEEGPATEPERAASAPTGTEGGGGAAPAPSEESGFLAFWGYRPKWEYRQLEEVVGSETWKKMAPADPRHCFEHCRNSVGMDGCVGFAAIEYPHDPKNRVCMFYQEAGLPKKGEKCGQDTLLLGSCYVASSDFVLYVLPEFAAERNIRAPPSPPPPPPHPISPPPFDANSKRKDFTLTQEYAAEIAKDNLVVVTWANLHMLDFTLNWAGHLEALGITNFMIGAMDQPMLEALVSRGYHAFSMNLGSLTTNDFGWGSPTFHKMGRQKITLCKEFLEMGFDILLTDVDTVYLRDPLPFIAQYPSADVLVSSDMLGTTLKDGEEGLERRDGTSNIGIMYFKHGEHTTAFLNEWKRVIDARPDYWDQNAFNDLYKMGKEHRHNEQGLFRGWKKRLTLGILSVSQWCSGHTYFVQQMWKKKKVEPYVVHATFQFAGSEGKRHRFREAKLWLDPPKYYNPPNGVLHFKPQIDGELLRKAGSMYNGKLPSSKHHFELVHGQLRQIRNALGLAFALGRHLVLPPLWCGIDRVWFPHTGVFPGSQLSLPFQCPVDHVIEIQAFVAREPKWPVLEHSFLENPRLHPDFTAPAATKHIQLGKDLPPNSTDVEVVAALGGLAKYKVVEVDRLVADGLDAFAGFVDASKQTAFEERLMQAMGVWGTAQTRPGHVHYDFFADKYPWTDKFGRKRKAPWTLVGGEQAFPKRFLSRRHLD